jgi:predicted DNA-binding transcriptional regulator AlpA
MKESLSIEDLLGMPAVVDVATAGQALGIGRTTSYRLARSGQFPCRIMRVGTSYRVPAVELLRVLGLWSDPPTAKPADSKQQEHQL